MKTFDKVLYLLAVVALIAQCSLLSQNKHSQWRAYRDTHCKLVAADDTPIIAARSETWDCQGTVYKTPNGRRPDAWEPVK